MHDKIRDLLKRGYSRSAVARELGIHRNTVSKYAKPEQTQEQQSQEKSHRRLSGFDIAKDYIVKQLETYPDISSATLYEKVLQSYPHINQKQRTFRHYLKNLKAENLRASSENIQSSDDEIMRTLLEPFEMETLSMINDICSDLKLSKKNLAKITKAISPLIAYYETGYKQLSEKNLIKLANFLNIPLEDYFSVDDQNYYGTFSVEPQRGKTDKNIPIPVSKNVEVVKEEVHRLGGEIDQIYETDQRKALLLTNRILALSEEIGYDIGIGLSYLYQGELYSTQDDYANALKCYFFAEPIFRREGYYEGLRVIYNNIGCVYYYWNDLENALKHYIMNIELETKCSKPELTSIILNNIGLIYIEMDEFQKALQYFKDAIEINQALGDFIKYSVALNNIAKVYLNLNNPDKALESLKSSIAISKEQGAHINTCPPYIQLSRIKAKDGNYGEAIGYLDIALNIASEYDKPLYIALIYKQYAIFHSKMGQEDTAGEFLHKCIKIAERSDFRVIALEAYTLLSELYEKKSDYRSAYECILKIHKLNDFLHSESKFKSIQEIKTRMEVEQNNREKTILFRKNAELKKVNDEMRKQKKRLELTEKKLTNLNAELEVRVLSEINKRRQQEEYVIQKSKLESLGQLAAGIVHEISQPIGLISIINSNLLHQTKSNSIDTAEVTGKCENIDRNIFRIKKTIEHIRLFSRNQKESKETFNVLDSINDAVSMLSQQIKMCNITLKLRLKDSSILTTGNKFRLEQVFINILSNSIEALKEKGEITGDNRIIVVTASIKKKHAILEFYDNGIGMDGTTLLKVFDPFFTTKSPERGTGLGMSICYGIIKDMGGTISLKSKPAVYTRVSIELPGIVTLQK